VDPTAPPYPLETAEDRRFVLRAQAAAGLAFAPLLVLAGLADAGPKFVLFGVASFFGGAQAVLALRGASGTFVRGARVLTVVAFAAGVMGA
jgi:hypothetical protein